MCKINWGNALQVMLEKAIWLLFARDTKDPSSFINPSVSLHQQVSGKRNGRFCRASSKTLKRAGVPFVGGMKKLLAWMPLERNQKQYVAVSQ